MDKFFLIDGHAQIFRMFYAFMRRPMINSKGDDTSILFGFTKMLLDLINKEHPTHIAVAFDPPCKTFRHESYPLYKANRTATPELVKAALDPLKEILKALRIPVVMINGFEADDVIGSMVKQWNNAHNNIFMVTPDKDYGQLVSDNIYQYKPAKGGNEIEIIDKKKICETYGISDPEQVIDILSIWGDTSDNVPGVKGIGEVGAKKLVGKYGTVENVMAHINELPQKQQESFSDFKEQMAMSKFLVTIKTDIELPLGIDAIKIAVPDDKAIKEVFDKYEFNSLKKLISFSDQPEEREEITEEGELPEITKISIEEMASLSKTSKIISVVKEENCIAISIEEENGKKYKVSNISDSRLHKLQSTLENPQIIKTGNHLKEFIKVLKKEKIQVAGEYQDIELMHYLINPERIHYLDFLIKWYLKIDPEKLIQPTADKPLQEADLFSDINSKEEPSNGNKEAKTNMLCALEIPLHKAVLEDLKHHDQLELYKRIEMPLIEVLAAMENAGFKIDIAQLKEYSKALTKELAEIEQRAKEMAGEPDLVLSSPKQVGILLFDKLRLDPKVKKTKSGNYSTDEETLNGLRDRHPIINDILEYRAIRKLLSTYVDNLPYLINPATGKIHTSFNQALTSTGRLSSSNPNLQNIPIRTERGKEIRKAFIPSSPQNYIVSADYSQIELRLMAHLSNDEHFIDAFINGKDVHAATAAKIFKIAENEVTREQRSRAKTANFGIIYGISAFGLSQRLGISRSESKELIEQYFSSYPGVKNYIETMIQKGKDYGYVETIFGRRRYLPEINSKNAIVRGYNERNAINAPLQGSAADIIKLAMINVYNRLKKEKMESKLILQVHDELVLDVPNNELDASLHILKEEMENVTKLKVPLTAECGYGKNWLEAH